MRSLRQGMENREGTGQRSSRLRRLRRFIQGKRVQERQHPAQLSRGDQKNHRTSRSISAGPRLEPEPPGTWAQPWPHHPDRAAPQLFPPCIIYNYRAVTRSEVDFAASAGLRNFLTVFPLPPRYVPQEGFKTQR